MGDLGQGQFQLGQCGGKIVAGLRLQFGAFRRRGNLGQHFQRMAGREPDGRISLARHGVQNGDFPGGIGLERLAQIEFHIHAIAVKMVEQILVMAGQLVQQDHGEPAQIELGQVDATLGLLQENLHLIQIGQNLLLELGLFLAGLGHGGRWRARTRGDTAQQDRQNQPCSEIADHPVMLPGSADRSGRRDEADQVVISLVIGLGIAAGARQGGVAVNLLGRGGP